MLRQLVHSKSDTNFVENKQIIDDISNNMQHMKRLKKKKEPKVNSSLNSSPSTPTTSNSCSSFNHCHSHSPKNAHHFFTYLIQIFKIKKVFEKGYFKRFILPIKLNNNIITQVIREYAKREFSRFDVSPQLISDFDQIINIVNNVSPESLFKEIKTKILVAFEIVQLKIKNVLQLNKQSSSLQQITFFNSISHIVCFILSTITYRVDYYSFTMNRFVEKFNKYFDNFLDDISPGNGIEYNFCLRFIQRYIKIKLKFIDEFYQEETRYTKFNSLGRYLFNNLTEFIILFDSDTNDNCDVQLLKECKPVNTSMFDKSYWIHYKSEVYHLDDSSCKLSTYFKMFFNSRLAKWKNDFFHPILSNCNYNRSDGINGGIDEEEEICRICEQKIKLKHYYLHIYYCLNYVISYQALKKNRKIVKGHIKRIKEINNKCNSNSCTIDNILLQITNENNCPFDSYETDSIRCFKLLSLINEIMINCISSNTNTNTTNTMACFSSPTIDTNTTAISTTLSSLSSSISFNSPCVNRSLLQLVSVLMKRFRIVVDILTMKEMRTKNKLSYCSNHYARLSPIIHKAMSKSTRETADRKVKFDNFSYQKTDSLGKKTTDFSSMKIKQTLNELKTITKDELLTTKIISKSKFGQSYSNDTYNDNLTTQETTIEIYPDINQNDTIINDDSPIMAIIPKISDFNLICPIAKGGYGRVDLYKKISTGDVYAIKTVCLESMQDASQAELLKNETSISNEIDSEYIVKCYYTICENSYFYFISEYMAGRDLLQLLNSTILSYETIQLITAEILLGIEYLHSKGIVHKDIKPENVVISKDGHFKLTDFGISEIYNNRGNKYTIGNSENIYQDLFDINDDYDDNDNDTEGYSNTKKDQLGTLYYMAPEVFTNDQFTTAVDYWSLGVLLYELFTLKQPFFGNNTKEIKENIISSNINWTFFNEEDVVANYSIIELNNAKDIISKLLIKDAALRYSTKDLSKIKSHPFFKGINWKEIKPIKDPQVLLHVKKMVEKTNMQIKEYKKGKIKQQKHNNQTFPQVLSTSEKKKFAEVIQPFYYSERVDNIFKKCQETMHRIINSNKFKENVDNGNNKENNLFNTSISSTSTTTTTNNTIITSNNNTLNSSMGSNPFTNFDY